MLTFVNVRPNSVQYLRCPSTVQNNGARARLSNEPRPVLTSDIGRGLCRVSWYQTDFLAKMVQLDDDLMRNALYALQYTYTHNISMKYK